MEPTNIRWSENVRPTSPTPALVHHHVLVVAKHHVVVVVVVEHGDGREADGHAARLRRDVRVQGVHQGLQDGVVGAVEALAQRERALAVAVVGQVALRRDDPVLPAHVLEVDVEAAGPAHVAGRHGQVDGAPPLPGATLVGVEGHGHQRGPDQRQGEGRLQREGVPGAEGQQLLPRIAGEGQQLQQQAVVASRFAPALRQRGEVHGDGGGFGMHGDRLRQHEPAAGLGVGSPQRGPDHFVQSHAEGPGPLQELPVELDLQLSQRQQLHGLQDGQVEVKRLLQAGRTAAAPARYQRACRNISGEPSYLSNPRGTKHELSTRLQLC